MEQNVDNKIELKDRLGSFYIANKLKIYSFIGILIIILISITFIKINEEKKNNLISAKYIQAGLYFASGKKEESKLLYKEIIISKNKFYSILALNNILEKNLVPETDEVLSYFNIVAESIKNEEQLNLINFKKALYLIKISNITEGNKLLKELIDKETKLKPLVEEILAK